MHSDISHPNHSFRGFVGFQACNALADALLFVALPFLVLPTAGSEGLGWVVALGAFPRFLGPLLGALADRLHLKMPLVLMALGRSLLCLSLVFEGQVFWWVCTVALLNGLLTTFAATTSGFLVPALAGPQHLKRANSILTGVQLGLPLVGYGGAGLALTWLTPTEVVLGSALLLGLGLLPLLGVAFPQRPARVQRPLQDLIAGWQLLRNLPGAWSLLLLSALLNLLLSVLNVLMPAHFAHSPLGAQGYGWFEGCLSAGALLGVVASSRIGQQHTFLQLAVGATLLGLAAPLPLAVPALALWAAGVFGLGLGLLEIAAVTLLQLQIPSAHRSKVFGCVLGINALGLSLGGKLPALLPGLPLLVWLGCAVVLLGWLRFVESKTQRPAPAVLD